MDISKNMDDMEVLTITLGPYTTLEETLTQTAAQVGSSLLIEAQSFHRSPASVSHSIVTIDTGFVATVIIVTQAGLVS